MRIIDYEMANRLGFREGLTTSAQKIPSKRERERERERELVN
jgi:hypothetical protein